MKRAYLILLVFFAFACGKTNVESLSLLGNSITVTSAGGEQQFSILTNVDWTASSHEDWLTIKPSSGGGSTSYQVITVVITENSVETERTASITVNAGAQVKTVRVVQSGTPKMTIAEFRAKQVSETTWYRLSGEIAAIESEEYGNFFIFDETGFVYVYGLCEKQVGKSKNDQSFSKLGLKVGDSVTMMTLRSEHKGEIEAGGTTPAYFVSKTSGTYKMGKKVSSTSAKWMELPETSSNDGKDILMHSFPDGMQRSYSAYWDYDNLLALWVAYPLCSGNIGSGSRTDKFCLDPLLERNKQPYLSKAYTSVDGNSYDRGHQIPSADRLSYRTNFETFFGTNMTPQNDNLNSGIWGTVEAKLRTWAKKSDTDTLYVVTGCTLPETDQYVLDSDEKHVTIPQGYYKAVLRLATDKSYSAIGMYFDNKANPATSLQKDMVMSISDLEKKVGVNFFVNLPSNIQVNVESQNPAEVEWWWNN